jgi:hypothetical protein
VTKWNFWLPNLLPFSIMLSLCWIEIILAITKIKLIKLGLIFNHIGPCLGLSPTIIVAFSSVK